MSDQINVLSSQSSVQHKVCIASKMMVKCIFRVAINLLFLGIVAAAHTAHISRPWVDNFGKFVHEATNKHHRWFWTLRKQQVEQEINKIQQEIQNIKLNSNAFGNIVQQARKQHLQSRIKQLSREVTEIKKQLNNKQASQQLQHNP